MFSSPTAMKPGRGRLGAGVCAGCVRAREIAFDYGPVVGAAALIVAAVQAWSMFAAAPADALDLNPTHWVSSLTGDVAGLGSSVFVRGFVAILNSLFTGLEAKLSLQVLTWLTLTADQTGGHVAALYNLTSGMAIGLLGAVLTVSIVRYWISGLSLSGSGGFEAIEGLLRTLAAVGFLLVWPFLFGQLIAVSNIASATILGDPSLRTEVAHIINTVVLVTFAPGGAVGLFISIVVAVAGAILFLGLLFMKVMIGAAITFLFVAMPLAGILWPIDELSWVARYAVRAFVALLIVPVVWALIFATFAAVSVNALEFQGAHGFINQVTQPLVAIAMLWLTITVPRTLFKLASSGLGLGRHGGGFVSRAGSYLAARQGGEFLAAQGLLPFGRNGFATAEPSSPVRPQRSGPTASGGLRTTTAGSTSVVGGAASAGATAGIAEAAAEIVAAGKVGGAGAAAGKASEASEVGVTGTRGEEHRSAELDPDREEARGPAVGRTRPIRDHRNPVGARPPVNPGNTAALEQAMAQSKNMPPPSVEEAHSAARRLEPGVRQHMSDAYEQGGPKAVQREMALLLTSTQISNPQAQDFMTLARASEHGLIEGVIGVPPPSSAAPASEPPPSTRPSTPQPPVAPYRPGVTQQPPPTTEPEWTPERSAHRETRDDAWRRGGTGVNPHQD